eukprot:UN03635
MACGILYVNEFDSMQSGVRYVSNVNVDSVQYKADVYVSNVYGFVYCDGSKDIKTMIGEYIGVLDVEAHVDVNDDGEEAADIDSEEVQQPFDNSGELSGGHIFVGTIIACSILFCGFVTMAYIVYIY